MLSDLGYCIVTIRTRRLGLSVRGLSLFGLEGDGHVCNLLLPTATASFLCKWSSGDITLSSDDVFSSGGTGVDSHVTSRFRGDAD